MIIGFCLILSEFQTIVKRRRSSGVEATAKQHRGGDEKKTPADITIFRMTSGSREAKQESQSRRGEKVDFRKTRRRQSTGRRGKRATSSVTPSTPSSPTDRRRRKSASSSRKERRNEAAEAQDDARAPRRRRRASMRRMRVVEATA